MEVPNDDDGEDQQLKNIHLEKVLKENHNEVMQELNGIKDGINSIIDEVNEKKA